MRPFKLIIPSLWIQGVAIALPLLTLEFGPSSTDVRYTTCALFVGLCIGSAGWGIASDIIGRRLAFNATLFLAGAFGLAAGAPHTGLEFVDCMRHLVSVWEEISLSMELCSWSFYHLQEATS